MRRKIGYLFNAVLIVSLLSVLIGSYLSFHTDSYETSHEQSISSQMDQHGEQHCSDPCESGFCHLGHCAKLVIYNVSWSAQSLELNSLFVGDFKRPSDCFLEGPFQPPRV
ncbi:MAG: hypothetical protein J7501_00995 [Bdellovibrio sp.]|nr:hypothetical protein [Bdellovibrio sp.]